MSKPQKDSANKLQKEALGEEIWVTKFDEESAQIFREQVIEQAKESQTEPIVVYIDSYGGYVDALAKMIETLDEVTNPIITVCMGKAMSCGAMLLSHGDVRFIGRHSRVMIHEISSGAFGDVHDIHNDAMETKRQNKYFMGLLAKNCHIKGGYDALRKIIKDRDGRDIYLVGPEAVKFGIADYVGLPKLVNLHMSEVMVIPEKKKIGVVKEQKATQGKQTKRSDTNVARNKRK